MKFFLLSLPLLLPYAATEEEPIKLPGYVACQASIAKNSGDVLTCYTAEQDCQNGTVVLAYEKRLSKPSEKALYAIVDTVQLTISYPRNNLFITECTGPNGKPNTYFVVVERAALGAKYFRSVRRAWGVTAQGQLVEVATKTLKCLNQDFGAD